jgi:hypothetical protein
VLRIRGNAPSTRRFHDGASKVPCIDTIIVESDVSTVLGDISRAGFGGGLPRIAYSRECALESAIWTPPFLATEDLPPR